MTSAFRECCPQLTPSANAAWPARTCTAIPREQTEVWISSLQVLEVVEVLRNTSYFINILKFFYTELMNRLRDHYLGYEALICQLPVFHRQFFSPPSHDILYIYIRKYEEKILINFNHLIAWIAAERKKKKGQRCFSIIFCQEKIRYHMVIKYWIESNKSPFPNILQCAKDKKMGLCVEGINGLFISINALFLHES